LGEGLGRKNPESSRKIEMAGIGLLSNAKDFDVNKISSQ
jgi:hypothetical protein